MNVVIAIDSFKGSMTSMQAGLSAATGIKRVYKDAHIPVRPLADGGEGTVDALVNGCDGRMTQVQVTGPSGHPVVCPYGIVDETHTAIIEMSGAAGITQVSGEEKNPLNTTTYGVGEVIKDAIQNGCRHFIVGIGGSATNDGGVGMLQALGFGFLDKNGNQIRFGAKGLEDLESITTDHVLPELKECTFRIACDVSNPLCGEQGCSAIYGPQKGATSTMILQMDKWLAYYAALAREQFPHAFSGCVAKEAVACNAEGIDAFFPILRNVVSLDEAMHTDNAMTNMADTAEQVFRTIQTFSSVCK